MQPENRIALLHDVVSRPEVGEQLQLLMREVHTSVVSLTSDGESHQSLHDRLVSVRSLSGGSVGDAWTNSEDAAGLRSAVATARSLRAPAPAAIWPQPVGHLGIDGGGRACADLADLRKTALMTMDRVARDEVEITVGESLTSTTIVDSAGGVGHQERTEAQLHGRSLRPAEGGVQAAALTTAAADLPVDAVVADFAACQRYLSEPRYNGPPPAWFVMNPLVTARFLSRLSSALFTGPGREPPIPLGTRVGSDALTIIDDGTLHNGPGSKGFDDEGTPTQRTTVVDSGVLRRHLGSPNGLPRTGNVRRSPWETTPGLTSTNMFLAPTQSARLDAAAMSGTGFLAAQITGFRGGLSLNGAGVQFFLSGVVLRDGELLGTSTYAVSLQHYDLLSALTAAADPIAFYRIQGVFGGSDVLIEGIPLMPI